MARITRTKQFQNPNHIFVSVYQKFGTPLMKFILKRMGADQDAAEEIFAKTMAAAWKGFGTFEYKSSYFTWICRIALNKIADYYRGQINERSRFVAPFLEDIANIEDKNLTPEEDLVLQELRVSIRNCLNVLPSETRNLMYLKYWEQLTIKQIAKRLHLSERSVEGKVYRGKQLLKKVLSLEHPEIAKIYTK
jgi:RNA polymerase sigma-70 factor, ECF subfamily